MAERNVFCMNPTILQLSREERYQQKMIDHVQQRICQIQALQFPHLHGDDYLKDLPPHEYHQYYIMEGQNLIMSNEYPTTKPSLSDSVTKHRNHGTKGSQLYPAHRAIGSRRNVAAVNYVELNKRELVQSKVRVSYTEIQETKKGTTEPKSQKIDNEAGDENLPELSDSCSMVSPAKLWDDAMLLHDTEAAHEELRNQQLQDIEINHNASKQLRADSKPSDFPYSLQNYTNQACSQTVGNAKGVGQNLTDIDINLDLKKQDDNTGLFYGTENANYESLEEQEVGRHPLLIDGRSGIYRLHNIHDYRQLKEEAKLTSLVGGASRNVETMSEKKERLAIHQQYGRLIREKNRQELIKARKAKNLFPYSKSE